MTDEYILAVVRAALSDAKKMKYTGNKDLKMSFHQGGLSKISLVTEQVIQQPPQPAGGG